ncbi:MAG: ABC transporter permease [Phascolarctobacterium sp.]
MSPFMTRLIALTKKEFRQLLRDNSSLLIGIFLPLVLVFVIGYGVTLDIRNIPTAVVLEDTSPSALDMLSFTRGSAYFSPHYTTSMHEAEQLMVSRKVEAIIRVPANFTEALHQGRGEVQIIVRGTDSVTANMIAGYAEAGIAQWQSANITQFQDQLSSQGVVTVNSRIMFNDANSSVWYLIPGLLVLIITLVGVFLTALLMAREWERGTLESLFITPVRPLEIMLAKMLPYFCIAMIGFTICYLAARLVFGVPLHGSLAVLLVVSMIYIIIALGMGLVISAATKNQFLACQIAIASSLMPCMMLSGIIFDLRSVPALVRAVGYALPPTYYVELSKTLFLAGNHWPLILKNTLYLIGYAIFFFCLAWKVTKKRLE